MNVGVQLGGKVGATNGKGAEVNVGVRSDDATPPVATHATPTNVSKLNTAASSNRFSTAHLQALRHDCNPIAGGLC